MQELQAEVVTRPACMTSCWLKTDGKQERIGTTILLLVSRLNFRDKVSRLRCSECRISWEDYHLLLRNGVRGRKGRVRVSSDHVRPGIPTFRSM